DLIKYIGKESNHLEDVDAGLVHSEQSLNTEYSDPRRDEWELKILPALKRLQLSDLLRESGLCRSVLFEILARRSRSDQKNRERLGEILQERGGFGVVNCLPWTPEPMRASPAKPGV